MELVQEIHHLLMDREDTCHRTCFSLQLNGVTLDNFAELKNIEGLVDGSVIKVVEEPYTVREARIHVRHVRDLLKSLDPVDAYNGVDCNSLSFLSTIAQGDVLGQSLPGNMRVQMRSFPCSSLTPASDSLIASLVSRLSLLMLPSCLPSTCGPRASLVPQKSGKACRGVTPWTVRHPTTSPQAAGSVSSVPCNRRQGSRRSVSRLLASRDRRPSFFSSPSPASASLFAAALVREPVCRSETADREAGERLPGACYARLPSSPHFSPCALVLSLSPAPSLPLPHLRFPRGPA